MVTKLRGVVSVDFSDGHSYSCNAVDSDVRPSRIVTVDMSAGKCEMSQNEIRNAQNEKQINLIQTHIFERINAHQKMCFQM